MCVGKVVVKMVILSMTFENFKTITHGMILNVCNMNNPVNIMRNNIA